ncbi:MAG: DUF1631 family protein [Rubrivivax sp.]
MNPPALSPQFQQFVEDELLRAPMLYDRVLDAMFDGTRRRLAGLHAAQRHTEGEILRAMRARRQHLSDCFVQSLREQVQAELRLDLLLGARTPDAPRAKALALVDEEEVAAEVELSHAIEAIKDNAEYELRELQTYVAAIVGDLDMSADHNPFRPATFARAAWAAAQALPLSRGHQVAFMRACSEPLAQILRTSYAASTSRLEGQGVEPAAFRTLILPSGSRVGARSVMSTFSPDLQRMREAMPARPDATHGTGLPGATATALRAGIEPLAHWHEVARGSTQRAERQAVELVSRLFDAMITDPRVPQDVALHISHLRGPAMRLALREGSLLDQDHHPLWRFINQLVFVAEMSPEAGDPERRALLRTAKVTIEQLASETVQYTGLYRWAWERLQVYLGKRLGRRLFALASQIAALQKADTGSKWREAAPSTHSSPLDGHQLDTVPADVMACGLVPHADATDAGEAWLSSLSQGDWVRLFLNGRWLQVQLVWRGERQGHVLFGDGASDATWAVRRSALLLLHGHRLVKTLRVRSIVGSAAQRVQQDVATETAA